MLRSWLIFSPLLLVFCAPVYSQEFTAIEVTLDRESFFTDTIFTAQIILPEAVREPVLNSSESLSVLSVELSEEQPFVASIKFLPQKTGLISVPALIFLSDSAEYRTVQKTISVSSPQESEDIHFSMTPVKEEVYVGEPLRLDVVWKSSLQANQIRSLNCYPNMFTRNDAKVVIPRTTVDKEQQLGLPFGGRRIIGERVISDDDRNSLGMVRFPLYLQFNNPGVVTIPASRLEIAYLKQPGEALAPYTAYFNNGLFDSQTELKSFDRLYAQSEELTIKVKALPEQDQTEFFSGLFAPCNISASIDHREVTVGGVCQVKLRVVNDAPHEMIGLPSLRNQPGLRSRFRWGGDFERKWLFNGSEFSARLRPLTTDVASIPSFQFQIFNPSSGRYEVLQTEALPLRVSPQKNGQTFYDIRSVAPETNLTNQPEGVWHNTRPGFMNHLINGVINFFANYFWVLLLLGPVAFVLLFKRVQEARRRAIDRQYRAQAEAYDAFVSIPENCVEKWQAFQYFLATGCGISGSALTWADTFVLLKQKGVNSVDIEKIVSIYQQTDAADFAKDELTFTIPELNPIAERLFAAFKKAVILLVVGCLSMSSLRAGQWDEAEQFFTEAIEAPAGEPNTLALFMQSALKFEAAALDGEKIGYSWANAGNAWFKAGELGRAISCYRQARVYRPFDAEININLKTARALCVDVVEDHSGFLFDGFPVRWLATSLVLLSWVLVGVALLYIRYRDLTSKIALGFFGGLLLLNVIWMVVCFSRSGTEGVVIASNVYARKGPSYSYQKAFNEALHDGLEFRIGAQREEWLQIILADQRVAWVPKGQVRVLLNER